MTTAYFNNLSKVLKRHDRAVPFMVLGLDVLDKNIEVLKSSISSSKNYRVVVKSLPSPSLVNYVMEKMKTNNLMVFYQPFLSQLAEDGNQELDILLGKPMPVKTARYFYNSINSNNKFNPYAQIQWLVDTPNRIQEYIELAKSLNQQLRLNIELDVGLHRGGITNAADLKKGLQMILDNKDVVTFSGFMGYDPHVVKLPKLIKSKVSAFKEVNDKYSECIQLLKSQFPELYRDDLTFNGAGSPTLEIHENGSVINDVAAGSALVKPTTFDIPSLEKYIPSVFIATPILKKLKGTVIPGVESLRGVWNWIHRRHRNAYFIYGGYWKADYVYPNDAKENSTFGSSTNQSMVNSAQDLEVDDFVFLRPHQSEFVMLQFGDIITIRGGEIVDTWPVFQQ